MAKRMLSGGVRKQGWNFKGPLGMHQLYHQYFCFSILCVMVLEFHNVPSSDFNICKTKEHVAVNQTKSYRSPSHDQHGLCPGALSAKLRLYRGHSQGIHGIISNNHSAARWLLAVSFLWVCEEDGNSDLVAHGAIHQAYSNSLEKVSTSLEG